MPPPSCIVPKLWPKMALRGRLWEGHFAKEKYLENSKKFLWIWAQGPIMGGRWGGGNRIPE